MNPNTDPNGRNLTTADLAQAGTRRRPAGEARPDGGSGDGARGGAESARLESARPGREGADSTRAGADGPSADSSRGDSPLASSARAEARAQSSRGGSSAADRVPSQSGRSDGQRVHSDGARGDVRQRATSQMSGGASQTSGEASQMSGEASHVSDGARSAEATPSASEKLDALFTPDAANEFRTRWTSVQTRFVDDPRQAVRDGDELVAEVMKSLAQSFASERDRLESQLHDGGESSTELLRVALRRYRSFFERLLTL